MEFEVVAGPTEVEGIARGVSIRQRAHLNERYGRGRWRKLKGRAIVVLPSGRRREVELHWYEAHGIGAREHKIKTLLD
ncbi:MAG: hypothetical protein ACRDKJ_03555 [Actinomycetota bacterium]